MEALIALVVGVLVAASVWLMLARNLLRFIFGLVLISNAANLIIFAGGRLTDGAPPLVPEGLQAPPDAVANALPQALVLTAIVIGFGLFAFALVLVFRAHATLGTLDSDEMRLSEPRPDPPPAHESSGPDPARPRGAPAT
jgi:multicomponent Na+:H+ antiporter subunit C